MTSPTSMQNRQRHKSLLIVSMLIISSHWRLMVPSTAYSCLLVHIGPVMRPVFFLLFASFCCCTYVDVGDQCTAHTIDNTDNILLMVLSYAQLFSCPFLSQSDALVCCQLPHLSLHSAVMRADTSVAFGRDIVSDPLAFRRGTD